MASYRVYLMDRNDRIIRAESLEANDDDAALAGAHALCSHGLPTVEVWLGRRRIGAVPCDTKAEA